MITDASATNPYLVKIMPGVYDIGTISVQMKPYVDIEGSGENITRIVGGAYNVAVVRGASNAEIRYLALEGRGSMAIYNTSAAPKITNIAIFGSNYGIINAWASASIITNVTIDDTSIGIVNDTSSSLAMTNVTIKIPPSTPHCYGVYNQNFSSVIMKNVNIYISEECSSGVGVISYADSVKIDNSIITGLYATIHNVGTAFISNTKLDGGPITNHGSLKCINAYDGNYDPYTCP